MGGVAAVQAFCQVLWGVL